MLIFKKKKQTDKEYAHVEVYYNDVYLGYYMKNQSGDAARVGENWNFENRNFTKEPTVPSMYAETKTKLLEKINLFMPKS
jgi:hypothetical protein